MRASLAVTLLTAGLAAPLLLGAGPAAAEWGHAPVQPAAPQPIAAVMTAGAGTVAGSVTRVGATWFAVNDGTGEVRVGGHGLLPEGIRAGDPITVTGRARQDGLMAHQIVLADGSAQTTKATKKSHGKTESSTEGNDYDGDD